MDQDTPLRPGVTAVPTEPVGDPYDTIGERSRSYILCSGDGGQQ